MKMGAKTLISPLDLRDYLKSKGWLQVSKGLDYGLYVLENEDLPKRQLSFPKDIEVADYTDSVDAVLEKISYIYKIGINSIRSAITNYSSDVFQIRVFFDGDDRSLPLPFASSLVSSTEKLLKAGACTVLQPRINHPKLSLTEANQFVECSKFGQTEEGSFILNIACPMNSMDSQSKLSLDEKHAPFVRQVTVTLNRAISELINAIEADRLEKLAETLKQDKKPIISANLCDALATMYDDQVKNSIDISFNWSSLREPPETINRQRLRIHREYFSRIEELNHELKLNNEDKEDFFIGTVERLEGVMGEDGKRSGFVVLALLLPEGETVRARTNLNSDDYMSADKAHMQNGSYVRLKGKLRHGRQPRQLIDISNFQLLSDS